MANATTNGSIFFTLTTDDQEDGTIPVYVSATAAAGRNQFVTYSLVVTDSSGNQITGVTQTDNQVYQIPSGDTGAGDYATGAGTAGTWDVGGFTNVPNMAYSSFFIGSSNNAAPAEGTQFGNTKYNVPVGSNSSLTCTLYAYCQSAPASAPKTPDSDSAVSNQILFTSTSNNWGLMGGGTIGANDTSSDTDYDDTVITVMAYGQEN